MRWIFVFGLVILRFLVDVNDRVDQVLADLNVGLLRVDWVFALSEDVVVRSALVVDVTGSLVEVTPSVELSLGLVVVVRESAIVVVVVRSFPVVVSTA